MESQGHSRGHREGQLGAWGSAVAGYLWGIAVFQYLSLRRLHGGGVQSLDLGPGASCLHSWFSVATGPPHPSAPSLTLKCSIVLDRFSTQMVTLWMGNPPNLYLVQWGHLTSCVHVSPVKGRKQTLRSGIGSGFTSQFYFSSVYPWGQVSECGRDICPVPA